MITFQTSVRIQRPIDEVFAFVSDPLNFPRWNSAVQTVHGTSGQSGGPGSTYSMQRQLPTGRVENELEILSREHPTKFSIRTTSGPTPFLYHYRFARDGADTVIHLDASVDLPGVTAVSRATRGARSHTRCRLQPLCPPTRARGERARRLIPDNTNPTGAIIRPASTTACPINPLRADRRAAGRPGSQLRTLPCAHASTP